MNLRHMVDFGGRRFMLTVCSAGQVVHSMEGPVPIAGGLGSAANAALGNPSKLNCLDRRAILGIHR